MKENPIVSKEQWLTARKALLAREKELSKQRDVVAMQRRELPWVRVGKDYRFATASGSRSLADLFGRHSQLFVYHFMMAPGRSEGCPVCSMLGDHFAGATLHLAQRDVSFVAVSRAPLSDIDAFRKRMGWSFPWASSNGTSFNFDFGVSFTPEQLSDGSTPYNYATSPAMGEEMPGASVFAKNDAGEVFHTYSTYARGLDLLLGVYNFLDMVPKGRDEEALPFTMSWVRHHDRYESSEIGGDAAGSEPCEHHG